MISRLFRFVNSCGLKAPITGHSARSHHSPSEIRLLPPQTPEMKSTTRAELHYLSLSEWMMPVLVTLSAGHSYLRLGSKRTAGRAHEDSRGTFYLATPTLVLQQDLWARLGAATWSRTKPTVSI